MHRNIGDSDSEDELPACWEERATQDGNVYFINHITKATQWTHPRTGRKKVVPLELPYGWSKIIDENSGKEVFIDNETGKKSIVDPRLAFATDEKRFQDDIRQRFDSASTALQILHGRDLSGKLAIVTGANAGIGLETAKSLLRHGCKVIFACRNVVAAQEAIDNIGKEHKASKENSSIIHLNLTSLNSVKNFVNTVKEDVTRQIDILILNAAVFGLPYTETEDKMETTFQVNHLSHFYLAILLEPLLASKSRVIFVSSESHRFSSFKNSFSEGSLSPKQDKYSAMTAYNNSKLFNILGARYLSEYWRLKNISVHSLHPGNMVYTNLCKSWWLYKLAFQFVRPFTKSLQQAASTTIYCAVAPELEGTTGLYFNNCYRCDESLIAKDYEMAENVAYLCLKMIESRMGQDGIETHLQKLNKQEKTKADK